MLVKILGIIDLVGGIMLVIASWGIALPTFILSLFAVLFGLKSLFIFAKDIASIFDLFACLMFVLMFSFELSQGVLLVASILILQKGFFSLWS